MINEIASGTPQFSLNGILGTKTVKDFKRNFDDFDFRSAKPTSISQEATLRRSDSEDLRNHNYDIDQRNTEPISRTNKDLFVKSYQKDLRKNYLESDNEIED